MIQPLELQYSYYNALIGFIASRTVIKLRTDYLIITLMAMAEAARIIGINYYSLVGGTLSIHVPDLFAWMGGFRSAGVVIMAPAISIATFILVQALVTSPFGRLMKAIRESEVTAECIGKDVVKVKTAVIVVGSSLASLTGVLFSIYLETIIASAYTRTNWTFWPWLMVLMGGLGNNVGAAIGTLVVILVRRTIIFYKHYFEAYIPFQVIWLEQIMLGVALILIMIFRPQGLTPEKPVKIRGIRDYSEIQKKLKLKKLGSS